MVTGIVTLLIKAIKLLIQRLLFAVGEGLCWIVGFLTDIFEIVAGLETVTYKADGLAEEKLLIRAFFGNTNVNTIYWGMALIGIVMCIAFTIAAVIKKSVDTGDKMKQSMGDILRNCFKGVALILLMNFIISATISITSVLMDRIDYLITNAQNIDMSYDVTFDEDDYAAMARCLDKIGNFSLNASYNSRYNINECYNKIRPNLKYLADKGKFEITYVTLVYNEDGTTREANTWQSVLQNIYRSVDDITVDQPLDEYNDKLSEAILEAMSIIKNDASFEALEKYHVSQKGQGVGEMVSLDRMIMLIGSMYNSGMSAGSGFTDYLRGPYYYGQKDIFDYDRCDRDFNMELGTWLYLTVIVVAFLFIKEMLAMVFNATARIFNMLLLYISAPPFIAVTPLDDGGKLKQWTTAFIIQSFGLFGTVIALRLVMIFIPMLFSGNIQFFESARADVFARVIIMYGAIFTARKASGMIVGILADNAGMQAISAGDVGSEAASAVDHGLGIARTAGGMAWGLAKMGGGAAWDKLTKDKPKNFVEDKKNGNNGKNAPGSRLDMGGKKTAQADKNGAGNKGTGGNNGQKPTPQSKSSVGSPGTNGTGTTKGGGRFETGSSGSERDYRSPSSHSSLGGFDSGSSGPHTDFTSGSNRPTLDDEDGGSSNKTLPNSTREKFL